MTRPAPATPPETTARMGANGDAVSDETTADDRTLGLEGVIAAHRAMISGDDDGWHVICACGYNELGTEPAAHVAERVRAHLAPLGVLADDYERDASQEPHGGELWSTTANNLRAVLAATLGDAR